MGSDVRPSTCVDNEPKTSEENHSRLGTVLRNYPQRAGDRSEAHLDKLKTSNSA